MMLSLNQQNEESDLLREKFDKIRAYAEITCNRIKFMRDYFSKLASVYISTAQTIKPMNDREILAKVSNNKTETHISPGVPGRLIVNFTTLMSIQSDYADEITQFATFYEKEVNTSFDRMIKEQESMITTQHKIVQQVYKLRAEAAERYAHDFKNSEKLLIDANKAYIAHVEAKATGSPDSAKLASKVTKASESYRASVLTLESSTKSLNHSHRHLVRTIEEGIITLCRNENERKKNLYEVFKSFIDRLLAASEQLTKVQNRLSKAQFNWESDFNDFITFHQITRGMIPPAQFVPYKLNFEDPEIKIINNLPTYETHDIPLSVGLISSSFSGTNETELSILSGEYVLLFENGKSKWCLASSLDQTRIGYIPSCIIDTKIINSSYVVKTHTKENPGDLCVPAGVFLIIKERTNEGAICETLTGEQGFVPNECLASE